MIHLKIKTTRRQRMKELSLKGRVFPSDLNHQGSVFGGWVMSKMDKA